MTSKKNEFNKIYYNINFILNKYKINDNNVYNNINKDINYFPNY